MAVIMKTVVCWDVTARSMVKVYQCSKKFCCLCYQGGLYSVTVPQDSSLPIPLCLLTLFGAKGHADVGHSGTWEESPYNNVKSV